MTYSVSDANGKAADSVTRTVSVVDTTKPVITLGQRHRDSGSQDLRMRMREPAQATLLDGNLTGSVTSVSTVNTDAVGSYSVTYSVSDANGKAADSVTRTVSKNSDRDVVDAGQPRHP